MVLTGASGLEPAPVLRDNLCHGTIALERKPIPFTKGRFGVLRRFLICLAFATCCFLNTWVELAEGQGAHYARFDPLYAVVVPVLCWEILLTLGMFGVWEFCRRRPLRRVLPVHALFLASCFVPLGIASVAALRISPLSLIPIVRKPLFWPVALMAAVAPLGFAVLRPRSASRLMREIFLCSWPVLAVVLVQAARGTLLRYAPAAYADGPLAAPLESPPPRIRVMWVVFDGLSQAIAFGNRPAGLQVPNLDRLKAESFWATAAASPGDSTELSMPSLILGEPVVGAIPQAPNDLRLQTRSRSEPFAWSSVPNVFDTARELGLNTALVGWFHPYGRLLNRSLTQCYWTADWLLSGTEERLQPRPLLSAMWDRAGLQFAALPLVGHIPGVFPGIHHRREKRDRFSYLLQHAREIVADPSMGLALIHLPVPHPPAIYSRSKGALTAEGPIDYLDSVVLVDRTLGVLRQSMEQAGLWDRTAVLVSADHGWRTSMWRGSPEWTAEEEAASRTNTSGVPFLLKLPGQTSGAAYSKPFNTVVTRQIIADILGGRLTDPAKIPDWIERSGVEAR